MVETSINIAPEELAGFCRERGIRRLALFGSILRDDFHPGSDIDLLVEFEPGRTPGLIRFSEIELELSSLLGGVKVDLNTVGTLSPYFRDQVLAEARTIYG